MDTASVWPDSRFPGLVRLHAGEWEAEIVPGFGANLIALRHGGRSLLREPSDLNELRASPYLYGTPLLLPPNRIQNGLFTFDGQTYTLPLNEPARHNHIHGLMFNAPFTVLHREESSLTMEYLNSGDRYPFPFRLTITDTLSASGHHRRVRVQNIGHHDLPLTLASHVTFVEPDTFAVPIGLCWAVDDCYIPTGEKKLLTAEQQAYCTGCSPHHRTVGGFYEAAGNCARLDEYRFTVEGFDQWVLFNAGGTKGFLCIEPQLGPVNGLNRPDGYRRLAPEQTAEFSLSFS